MWWRRFRSSPLALVAATVLLLLVAATVLAPWLSPHDPAALNLRAMFGPPSAEHPLGTDNLGRDMLSRLLHAGRNSLTLATAVAALSLLTGCLLGGLAGFFGGRVDQLVSVVADTALSVPVLALAMVVSSLLQANLVTLTVVLALVSWPALARIMRAQVLSLREQAFTEAAAAAGAGTARVLFRHVAPNTLIPLIVAATLLVANVLLVESALSFLGYGLQPPNASWGGMLNESQPYYRQAPWLAVFPGMAITVAVAAINIVGDGLRAAVDVRRS